MAGQVENLLKQLAQRLTLSDSKLISKQATSNKDASGAGELSCH
jgi:hypothetical protein